MITAPADCAGLAKSAARRSEVPSEGACDALNLLFSVLAVDIPEYKAVKNTAISPFGQALPLTNNSGSVQDVANFSDKLVV